MTQEECENRNYPHNQSIRYDVGFHCQDCGIFFSKDSLTYRRYKLPSDYWMVLNNIHNDLSRNKNPIPSKIKHLMDKLWDAKKLSQDDLDILLFQSSEFAKKYGKDKNSATINLE